jgi:hypothetical protein
MRPGRIDQLPTVICERCDKRVDEIEISENPERRGLEIVVRCHGEKDQMFLPREALIETPEIVQVEGRAFAHVRLLPEPAGS